MSTLRWVIVFLLFLSACGSSSLAPLGQPSGRSGPHVYHDRELATTTTTTQPPRVKTQTHSHAVELAPAVQYDGDDAAVVAIIREVFSKAGPHVANQAIRVADCETGQTFNPAARNGVHVGLFQISGTYHKWRAEELGYTWEQVSNLPRPNAEVAFHLYSEQGWGPWDCKP